MVTVYRHILFLFTLISILSLPTFSNQNTISLIGATFEFNDSRYINIRAASASIGAKITIDKSAKKFCVTKDDKSFNFIPSNDGVTYVKLRSFYTYFGYIVSLTHNTITITSQETTLLIPNTDCEDNIMLCRQLIGIDVYDSQYSKYQLIKLTIGKSNLNVTTRNDWVIIDENNESYDSIIFKYSDVTLHLRRQHESNRLISLSEFNELIKDNRWDYLSKHERIIYFKRKYLKVSPIIINAAIQRKIMIGMPRELVIFAWGRPIDINTSVVRNTIDEQLVYDDAESYVYLTNGIVRGWQK
jgi:hypothetical protein